MTSEILLEIPPMKPQKVYRAVRSCILNILHSLKILILFCSKKKKKIKTVLGYSVLSNIIFSPRYWVL